MHCTHGTEGHAGNLPGAWGKRMVFLTTNFRKQLLGIDAQTRRYVFSAVKERPSVRSKYHNSFKQLLFLRVFTSKVVMHIIKLSSGPGKKLLYSDS